LFNVQASNSRSPASYSLASLVAAKYETSRLLGPEELVIQMT